MIISDTHTYCRTFRSRAVTTYLNDLGLSRLGFESQTYAWRVNAQIKFAPTAVEILKALLGEQVLNETKEDDNAKLMGFFIAEGTHKEMVL